MTEVIKPALDRLPDAIKLLHVSVDGLKTMIEKAEAIHEERVHRAIPYLGLIWLYGSGMSSILQSQSEGKMLWNSPALAALCRPLQEAFLSFYYFCIETPSAGEREFRELLLLRHQAYKRWDLLRHSDPSNPEIAAELAEAERVREETQQALVSHPFMQTLQVGVARRVRDDSERYIVDQMHDVWARASMPGDLYKVTFRYLSQYAHATPYAVEKLQYHQADSEDGAAYMSVPISLASTCVMMAIEHAAGIHADLDAMLPPSFGVFMRRPDQ